ncbi:MAG: hypothetical protein Tsb002_32620 [Wenzhouxiangellaceae bacterium]
MARQSGGLAFCASHFGWVSYWVNMEAFAKDLPVSEGGAWRYCLSSALNVTE